MLRVGLTGGLGSGKSTVAALLRERGAHVVSADDLGRELMQPGTPVFAALVQHFGPSILLPTGELDRGALGRLAFAEGRADELNRIIHPAVIARQAELARELEHHHPDAVFVVESALLFETEYGGPGGWRSRFDRVILVVAPEDLRVQRFVDRTLAASPTADPAEAQSEAGRRLALQLPDAEKQPLADIVLSNAGTLADLAAQTDALWQQLRIAAGHRDPSRPLI